jgi:hypothetical protein
MVTLKSPVWLKMARALNRWGGDPEHFIRNIGMPELLQQREILGEWPGLRKHRYPQYAVTPERAALWRAGWEVEAPCRSHPYILPGGVQRDHPDEGPGNRVHEGDDDYKLSVTGLNCK